MKTSGPDQSPKPQQKWSDGPPKPPKKTTRDLLDGGNSSDGIWALVSRTSETWFELEKLRQGLGAGGHRIRESLEVRLDTGVIALGDLLQQVEGVVRERVVDCLRSARDYRLHRPRHDPSNPGLAQKAQKVLNAAHEI
jgi:hypothetical protein